MSEEFYWVAVALVVITSAARLTRLLTVDEFPPVVAVRDRFFMWTDKTARRRKWQVLGYCGYCMSFWMTALVVAAADLTGVLDGRTAWGTTGELAQPLWWIIAGTFGASYLAAILMANDGDEDEDD